MKNISLSQMIKDAGLTYGACAEKAGISLSLLNRVKEGKMEPSNETIVRLAGALKTGPKEIIAAVQIARRDFGYDIAHLQVLEEHLVPYQPF